MNLQLLFLFRCKGCKDSIVLPRQSPLGTAEYPQYRATDAWPVTFVCTYCERTSAYSVGDIHLETVEALIPTAHSEALWKIEFGCAHENCGKHRAIYTKQIATADEQAVVEAVTRADPPLVCVGHDLILPQNGVAVSGFGYWG